MKALRAQGPAAPQDDLRDDTGHEGLDPRRLSDALVGAATDLVDQAIDRVLLTGERVTSAAEGRGLLAGAADVEDVADRVQRVVVLAVPVVRTLARGARFTRVPWVMVTSTVVSLGIAVRTGVRELQVIAAFVAFRLEQHTGEPADATLVKRLAVDLYLEPKRVPDPVEGRSLRIGRVVRRWIVSGAFGRDTSGRARKALDAVERLDVAAAIAPRGTSARRTP